MTVQALMDILSQMDPNDEVTLSGDFTVNGSNDFIYLMDDQGFDRLQTKFGNKGKNIKKILLKNTKKQEV